MCVECERNGEDRAANVVDHIIRINDGGSKLNRSNHQSLCKKCHDKKSASEGAKYRGMGIKVRTVTARTSHDSQLFTRNK
jgi:5-methylcytosine-specific restriction protein A